MHGHNTFNPTAAADTTTGTDASGTVAGAGTGTPWIAAHAAATSLAVWPITDDPEVSDDTSATMPPAPEQNNCPLVTSPATVWLLAAATDASVVTAWTAFCCVGVSAVVQAVTTWVVTREAMPAAPVLVPQE